MRGEGQERENRAAISIRRAAAERRGLLHQPEVFDKGKAFRLRHAGVPVYHVILISDRKVGNDFRDRIVSGEAKPAEHNGHIWSRASTKHGAILAGKNPRFLLDISISSRTEKTQEESIQNPRTLPSAGIAVSG